MDILQMIMLAQTDHGGNHKIPEPRFANRSTGHGRTPVVDPPRDIAPLGPSKVLHHLLLMGLIWIFLGMGWDSCPTYVRARARAGPRGPHRWRSWAISCRPPIQISGARDAASVGQQLAEVIEDHHTVAKQLPSLFGVEGHDAGGLVVRGVRGRTWRLVLTHDSYL